MLRARKLATIAAICAAAAAPSLALAADKASFKMQSAWNSGLPASGADGMAFSEKIGQVSGGSLEFRFYEPNKLVPALQIFDAVSAGTIEAGFTSPLYIAGKNPAVQLFSIPFGLTGPELWGWVYKGGGLELWREIYARHGVVNVPCSLMDAEAGGWFNKEINSANDLKGLKIRYAGLGGEVMKRMGASITLLAIGDVFPSLERGVLDGVEVSMPAIDISLGLHKVAKYLYMPGWQQQSSFNELIINKAKWDALNDSQRAAIDYTCRGVMMEGISGTYKANAEALAAFESQGVQVKNWPTQLLAEFRRINDEVLNELAAENEDFKRVYESLKAYRDGSAGWTRTRMVQ